MWYPCTRYMHVYTMYVHVYTMYVHGITNCLNRFSWPTQRCQCRGEGYPTALSCKVRWGSGQYLSRRWWFFYGRPDAAETEEAINKFISGLESQEQAGFDRLHTKYKHVCTSLTAFCQVSWPVRGPYCSCCAVLLYTSSAEWRSC